jgi:diguanylate cyclase (GGDEF)-like protein
LSLTPNQVLALGNPAIATLFAIMFLCVWRFSGSQRYLLLVSASFFVYAVGAACQISMIPGDVGWNTLITGGLYLYSAGLMARGIAARYRARISNATLIIVGSCTLAAITYFYYVDKDIVARIYILNYGSALLLLFPLAHWRRFLNKKAIDKAVFAIYLTFALSFFPRTYFSITSAVRRPLPDFAHSPFWLALQLTLAMFAVALGLALLAAAMVDMISLLRKERDIDGLTQLYNRRRFEEIGTEILRRRSREAHSLVLCDIDHFKAVNDRYGHAAGDHVLRLLGKIAHSCIRDDDIAARYGGEEFVVLLPGVSLDGAMRFAERMRSSLENTPFSVLPPGQNVTASFGVVERREGESLSRMCGRADALLYAAKSHGRNRIEVDALSPMPPAVGAAMTRY